MRDHGRTGPLLAAAVLAILVITGCDAGRKVARSLGELQKVSAAVARASGTAAVSVNLMNGRYLSVGIVNSPLGKLPPDARQAKAHELARAAYGAFPSRGTLASVRVTFVVQERRFLIVNYTNATDSFTFDPHDLGDQPGAGQSAAPSAGGDAAAR